VADASDSNDAVWRSDAGVASYLATAEARERRRAAPRRLLAELLPFADDEAFTFIDLGAGTGAAARAVLDRFPNARAVLADFSAQMRAEAEREMAGYAGRFSYVEHDLNSPHWSEAIPAAVPAVVTSLCVHHLPDERKQGLLAEIFARLAPGGWYLNFDAVSPPDDLVAAAWERANDREDPESRARREHASEEERLRHANHVRHMVPLGQLLDYVRGAGFEAVDVYWKELDFVIVGGRRPQ
jgi:trans-aconitate methyltransferase